MAVIAKRSLQNTISVFFAAFSIVLLSSCKGFLGFGSSGGKEALVVNPGDRIEIKAGPSFLGATTAIKEATFARVTGEEIQGLTTVNESSVTFQYARLAQHNPSDIVTLTLGTSLGFDIKVQSFLAYENPIADLATDKTVKFFKVALLRAPNDFDEIDKVYTAMKSAFDGSCIKGAPFPDLTALERASNNAVFSSSSGQQLIQDYKLKLDNITAFVLANNLPQIASGIPMPIFNRVTTANLYEGRDGRLSVKIVDGNRDLILSKWTVDGKETSEFPNMLVTYEDTDPSVPKAFVLTDGLNISTDYAMSSRTTNKTWDITLELCDGGDKVIYPYTVVVNDVNRPSEITAYPTDTTLLTIAPGQAKVVEVEARDVDGDPIGYQLSPGVRENIFLVPSDVSGTDDEIFQTLKKFSGLFVLGSDLRDRSDPTANFLQADPWLEVARTASRSIPIPTTMEFVPPSNGDPYKAVLGFPDPAHPTTLVYQESPVSFQFLSTSATAGNETLGFILDRVKLSEPISTDNARIYCITKENGNGAAYNLLMSCNLNRFPKSFDGDGEWILSYKCPNKRRGDPDPTYPEFNTRCMSATGTYLVAPDPKKISKSKIRVVVRPERYQGANAFGSIDTKLLTALVVASDDLGAGDNRGVEFQVTKAQAKPFPSFSNVQLFEQYQMPNAVTAPGTNFTRNISQNYKTYDLSAPETPDPNWSYAWGQESNPVFEYFRHPNPYGKDEWWQMQRWDMSAQNTMTTFLGIPTGEDPDLAVFKDRKFIRFLTAHKTNPETKLVLSALSSEVGDATVGAGNLYTSIKEPVTIKIENVSYAKMLKYEIQPSSSPAFFDFKLMNAKSKTVAGIDRLVDVYCRGYFNFDRGTRVPALATDAAEPMTSDFRIKCAEDQSSIDSKDTYLQYSPDMQGLVTMHPDTWGANDSVTPAYWALQRCQYWDTASNSSQYCDAGVLGYQLSFDWQGAAIGFMDAGDAYWKNGSFNFSGTDPEFDLTGYGGYSGAPNRDRGDQGGYRFFPKTYRLVLPDNMGDYRYCRYGLRNRMLTLALTCTNVVPTDVTVDAGFPTLYSKGSTGRDVITLEYYLVPYPYNGFPPFVWVEAYGKTKPGINITPTAADLSTGEQTLDTFHITSLGGNLVEFKVSYDNSAFDTPRSENANASAARPTSISARITRADNGDEAAYDGYAPQLFMSDELGNIIHIDDGSGSAFPFDPSIPLGVTSLAENEILVLWSGPWDGGEFNIYLKMERGSGANKVSRTLTIHINVEAYTWPPYVMVDNTNSTVKSSSMLPMTSVPKKLARKNMMLDGINKSLQHCVGLYCVYGYNPTLLRYSRGELNKTKIAPNLWTYQTASSQLRTFWLVDETGKLVDPNPSNPKTATINGVTGNWYDVWPFEADGTLKPNQILNSYWDGVSPDPFNNSSTNLLTPSHILNIYDSNPLITETNQPALSTNVGDFRFVYVDNAGLSEPVQYNLAIKINGVKYAVDRLGSKSSDGNFTMDFRVNGINATTMAADGTKKMPCRAFSSHPSGAIASGSTKLLLKVFCDLSGDNFVIPSGVTAPSIGTNVPAMNLAKMVAFTAEQTVSALASTDHSMATFFPTRPYGGLPGLYDMWFTQWNADLSVRVLGGLRWGGSATQSFTLKSTEAPGDFRGVMVVTDYETLVQYIPIEYVAVNQDLTPKPRTLTTSPSVTNCSSTSGMTVDFSETDPIDFSCYMDEYEYADATNLDEPWKGITTYWPRVLPVLAPGATPVPGSPDKDLFTLDSSPLICGSDNHPCRTFSVIHANWPDYPDPAVAGNGIYKPIIERVTDPNDGSKFRWRFSWKVPPLPADKQSEYKSEFYFNPGMEYPRKLASVSSQNANFYALNTKRLPYPASEIRQVANGDRDQQFMKAGYTGYATNSKDYDNTKKNWTKLAFVMDEPNRAPCLATVTTYLADQAAHVPVSPAPTNPPPDPYLGQACESLATIQNMYGGLSGASYIHLTNPSADHYTLTLDRFDRANIMGDDPNRQASQVKPEKWDYIYKNDSISLYLYIYDSSKTNGPRNTIGSVTVDTLQSSPGVSASIVPDTTTDDPKYARVKLTITPSDAAFAKNSSSPDALKVTVNMPDQKGKMAVLEIDFNAWDRNYPPTVANNSTANKFSSGTSGSWVSFQINARDSDSKDFLLARPLTDALPSGINVQLIDANNQWCAGSTNSPCLIRCTNGDCPIIGQFTDSAILKGMGSLFVSVEVKDQPWWIQAVNSAVGPDYYATHPKTSSSRNAYLDPSPAQVYTVVSLEKTSPELTTPSVIPITLYLNQTMYFPITSNNAVDATHPCKITSNLAVPLGNLDQLPTIQSITAVNTSAKLVLPADTSCVLVWTPKTIGWNQSSRKQVIVQVGQAGNVTFNFTIIDNTLAPGTGGRASLLDTYKLQVRNSSGTPLSKVLYPSDQLPVFTAMDGDKLYLDVVKRSDNSLAPSALNVTWYIDGKPVRSGAATHTFNIQPNGSYFRSIEAYVSDNSVILAAETSALGEQRLATQQGYQVLSGYVFARNTKPIADAADSSAFVGFSNATMSSGGYTAATQSMFLFHRNTDNSDWVLGFLKGTRIDSNDRVQPYAINFNTNKLYTGNLSAYTTFTSTFLQGDSTESVAYLVGEAAGGVGTRFTFNFATKMFTEANLSSPDQIANTWGNPLLQDQSALRFFAPIPSGQAWLSFAQVTDSYSSLNLQIDTSAAEIGSTGLTNFSEVYPAASDSIVVKAQDVASPGANHYYVLNNPTSGGGATALQIPFATAFGLGGQPNDGAKGLWISATDTSLSNANEHLFAATLNTSSDNFVYGALDVSTGNLLETTVSQNNTITLPTDVVTNSGGRPTTQIVSISPVSVTSGATKLSSSGTVIIPDIGTGRFYTVDMINGSVATMGVPNGLISQIKCSSDGLRCYLSDSKNQRIYRLK